MSTPLPDKLLASPPPPEKPQDRPKSRAIIDVPPDGVPKAANSNKQSKRQSATPTRDSHKGRHEVARLADTLEMCKLIVECA